MLALYKNSRKFTDILSLTLARSLYLKRQEIKTGSKGGKLPPEILHPQMTSWARRIMEILEVNVTVKGDPVSRRPCLYVGNHISYVDIPLLMSVVPVVFVAKIQIANWPIFGAGCRRVGTVFVERDSTASRKIAAESIGRYIEENKQSVVVFPSGTTTVRETTPWRWGAFQVAQKFGIPIKPFRLNYEPLRKTAFIEDDLFSTHLWNLLKEKITATLEFHDEVPVTDFEKDAERWWKWAQPFARA